MTGIGGGLSEFVSAYLRNRYKVMFYAILIVLIAIPILSALRFNGVLIEWLLAASLLAAILPVGGVRSRPYLLIAMLLVWLSRPLTVWLEHPFFSALTLALWTAIGLLATVAALRFAMRATAVDGEHLYAALSAYLMAGVFFGLLYFGVEQVSPGAFTSPTTFTQTSAIYFSFVTLATLGYGDIAPRGDIVRSFAIIEGVGGQLFLAVLVARLVSLYTRAADDRH
jgi:Ion channel